MLYRMLTLPVTLGDPNHPNDTFCIAFHIFVVSECRDFKFGLQVEHSKSQPMDDKLTLNGAWSRHVTNFKFLVPLKYLSNKLANSPPVGVVMHHVTSLNFRK